MAIYKLTNGSHIIADAGFIAANFPDAVYVGEEPSTTNQGSFIISKFAFKNRFPREKWVAAKAASATNANLADFFEDFALVKAIELDFPRTVASVNSLADPSVPVEFRLTAAEVSAVLDQPCQPGEEP